MKLAIGPAWSSPFVYRRWAETTFNLTRPPGWDVRLIFGEGWCPARRHSDLCEKALRWGADYIGFMGADQVYPEDTLVRLVSRLAEGYEVVAALVPARGYVSWQPMKPFQKMAWRFKAGNLDARRPYRSMELDADLMEVIQPHTGMQRCDFIGSGVLLFHRDHLLALKRPWFYETIYWPTYGRQANQDTGFVWRLQTEAHAQVWVDTDLDVKHLHLFEIDDTYSDRFPDWERAGAGDPAICRYREAVPA